MSPQAPGPRPQAPGHLIAFEGLDQSGKQTQAERLLAAFRAAGHASRVPDVSRNTRRRSAPRSAGRCRASATTSPTRCSCSTSPIASSSGRASSAWLAAGTMVVCDRYLASSIAYGEAQGVDAAWLTEIQRLPAAAVADDPARHPAGRVADAQESRRATSSSATCRCSAACAKATCARRRRSDWVRLEGRPATRTPCRPAVLSAVRSRLGLL